MTRERADITHYGPRTHAQRLAALALANHIRSARAKLKRDLGLDEHHTLLARVIRTPGDVALKYGLEDDGLDAMTVLDALMATRKLGRVKVGRIMALERLSSRQTLGRLTQRQRISITEHLP